MMDSRHPARRAKPQTTRITLLPPETAPMTEEQHRQAVSALSAMIVSWLNRRHMTEALDRRSNPHSDDDGRPIGDNRWRGRRSRTIGSTKPQVKTIAQVFVRCNLRPTL